MPDLLSTLREMMRRTQRSEKGVSTILENRTVTEDLPTTGSSVVRAVDIDPLDREQIVGERLSELSDSLGLRYRQVCRDLRDNRRLAWTADAHELRDILANVLRTLAPTEDVVAQKWYRQVEGTDGPTHAQRARFALEQNHSRDDAKSGGHQVELIDELISKIARSTYTTGSQLAHSGADYQDCVRLLFHFDALMFSLLNESIEEASS